MSLIATGELLAGLGEYLAEQQLAQYSSDGLYTQDDGRPGVRLSDADHPDSLLVLAVTGVEAERWFQVAMHFRAPGRDPSAVDGNADAIAEHFHEAFGLGARGWQHGTAVTMPSITLDGDLVLTNVKRKTRGSVSLTAPKPQSNASRYARTDVYEFSVIRK